VALDVIEYPLNKDLLKELLRDSSDPARRAIYAKILDPFLSISTPGSPGPAGHPYSQLRAESGDPNVYFYGIKAEEKCFKAACEFCTTWLGGYRQASTPLYELPPDRLADVEHPSYRDLLFPFMKSKGAIQGFIRALDSNKPIVVPLLRVGKPYARVGGSKRPLYYHWLGIVGYYKPAPFSTSAVRFLYFDPWPGDQSRCKYAGDWRNMLGYIRYWREIVDLGSGDRRTLHLLHAPAINQKQGRVGAVLYKA
jgi:hypothetical protein